MTEKVLLDGSNFDLKRLSFQYLSPYNNLLLDLPNRALDIIKVVILRLMEFVYCLLQERRWNWYTDEKIARIIKEKERDYFSELPDELIISIGHLLDENLVDFRLALGRKGEILNQELRQQQAQKPMKIAIENIQKIKEKYSGSSMNPFFSSIGGCSESNLGAWALLTFDKKGNLLKLEGHDVSPVNFASEEELNQQTIFKIEIIFFDRNYYKERDKQWQLKMIRENDNNCCKIWLTSDTTKVLEEAPPIVQAVVDKMIECFNKLEHNIRLQEISEQDSDNKSFVPYAFLDRMLQQFSPEFS